MYNNRFWVNLENIFIILLLFFMPIYIWFKAESGMINSDKNITTEIKVGKIIDSYKENIQGLFGGHIEYETAIKVDDEIIISNDKNIYYEAKDKIGKEIKVEVKNDKNIDKKYIEDIK
ncbi:hypothetical protein QJR26_04395 [Clostridium baratii]